MQTLKRFSSSFKSQIKVIASSSSSSQPNDGEHHHNRKSLKKRRRKYGGHEEDIGHDNDAEELDFQRPQHDEYDDAKHLRVGNKISKIVKAGQILSHHDDDDLIHQFVTAVEDLIIDILLANFSLEDLPQAASVFAQQVAVSGRDDLTDLVYSSSSPVASIRGSLRVLVSGDPGRIFDHLDSIFNTISSTCGVSLSTTSAENARLDTLRKEAHSLHNLSSLQLTYVLLEDDPFASVVHSRLFTTVREGREGQIRVSVRGSGSEHVHGIYVGAAGGDNRGSAQPLYRKADGGFILTRKLKTVTVNDNSRSRSSSSGYSSCAQSSAGEPSRNGSFHFYSWYISSPALASTYYSCCTPNPSRLPPTGGWTQSGPLGRLPGPQLEILPADSSVAPDQPSQHSNALTSSRDGGPNAVVASVGPTTTDFPACLSSKVPGNSKISFNEAAVSKKTRVRISIADGFPDLDLNADNHQRLVAEKGPAPVSSTAEKTASGAGTEIPNSADRSTALHTTDFLMEQLWAQAERRLSSGEGTKTMSELYADCDEISAAYRVKIASTRGRIAWLSTVADVDELLAGPMSAILVPIGTERRRGTPTESDEMEEFESRWQLDAVIARCQRALLANQPHARGLDWEDDDPAAAGPEAVAALGHRGDGAQSVSQDDPLDLTLRAPRSGSHSEPVSISVASAGGHVAHRPSPRLSSSPNKSPREGGERSERILSSVAPSLSGSGRYNDDVIGSDLGILRENRDDSSSTSSAERRRGPTSAWMSVGHGRLVAPSLPGLQAQGRAGADSSRSKRLVVQQCLATLEEDGPGHASQAYAHIDVLGVEARPCKGNGSPSNDLPVHADRIFYVIRANLRDDDVDLPPGTSEATANHNSDTGGEWPDTLFPSAATLNTTTATTGAVTTGTGRLRSSSRRWAKHLPQTSSPFHRVPDRRVFTVKRDLLSLCAFQAQLTHLLHQHCRPDVVAPEPVRDELLPPPFPDPFLMGALEEALIGRRKTVVDSDSHATARSPSCSSSSSSSSSSSGNNNGIDVRTNPSGTGTGLLPDPPAGRSRSSRWAAAVSSPVSLLSRSLSSVSRSMSVKRGSGEPWPIAYSAGMREAWSRTQADENGTRAIAKEGILVQGVAKTTAREEAEVLLEAGLTAIRQYLVAVFSLLEEVDGDPRCHVIDSSSSAGVAGAAAMSLASQLGQLISAYFLQTDPEGVQPSLLSSIDLPENAGSFIPRHEVDDDPRRPCWHPFAMGGLRLRLTLSDDCGSGRLSIRSDEELLRAQRARCLGCGEPLTGGFLGFDKNYQPCRFTGGLFCRKWCHADAHRPVPHRMVLYWDFKPHRCCREAVAFIDGMWAVPVVNLRSANPQLYENTHMLRLARNMRERIHRLISRMLLSRDSDDDAASGTSISTNEDAAATVRETVAQILGPDGAHLCVANDLYSMHDLAGVSSGSVLAALETIFVALKESDALFYVGVAKPDAAPPIMPTSASQRRRRERVDGAFIEENASTSTFSETSLDL